MLPDGALQVILATGGGHQPDLAVPPHNLAIEIEIRLRVLPERAPGDEALEVLPSLGIDLRRVNICGGRQIDLRLAHVEEAQRVAGSKVARLFGGHHIVGQLANARSQPRIWPQRGKWFNDGHR